MQQSKKGVKSHVFLILKKKNVKYIFSNTVYTVFHKKTTRYLIAHNFGKC